MPADVFGETASCRRSGAELSRAGPIKVPSWRHLTGKMRAGAPELGRKIFRRGRRRRQRPLGPPNQGGPLVEFPTKHLAHSVFAWSILSLLFPKEPAPTFPRPPSPHGRGQPLGRLDFNRGYSMGRTAVRVTEHGVLSSEHSLEHPPAHRTGRASFFLGLANADPPVEG